MSIDMGLKERLRPRSDDHVGQTGAVSMLAAAPVLRGVRVGVIGCGYWGSKHVRVLSGLAGVGGVAVIDPDPRIRGAITSAFPAVRGFPDLASALPHVDAAVVATPPRNHAEVALQALRAGKHVLVEKPITTTLVDARLLAAEARRSGVILMAGHTFEFNPAVRELRRRMDQGELGEIYYIHSARLNLGLYRSDVNVVWDLAPHDISIMNYLLRSTPTVVSAWGSSHACGEVKDLAYVRLQYAAVGVVGYAHVSWLDPRKTRRITVVGSRKMAVYDDLADEKLRILTAGSRAGCPARAWSPTSGRSPIARATSSPHGLTPRSRWRSRTGTSSSASATAPRRSATPPAESPWWRSSRRSTGHCPPAHRTRSTVRARSPRPRSPAAPDWSRRR
jgi:predicted dehydrogenase